MLAYLRDSIANSFKSTDHVTSHGGDASRSHGQPGKKSNVQVSGGKDKNIRGTGNTAMPKTFKVRHRLNPTAEELDDLTTKYPYSRPSFLDLSKKEEIEVALRHTDRMVILPKTSCLPRSAGYAE